MRRPKLIFEGKGANGYTLAGLAEAQHRLFPSMGGRVVPLFVPPQGLALLSPIALFPPDVIRYVWKTMLGISPWRIDLPLKKNIQSQLQTNFILVRQLRFRMLAYNSLRIDQLAPILLLSYISTIRCLEKKQDISAGLWLSLIVLKPAAVLAVSRISSRDKTIQTFVRLPGSFSRP